MLRLTLSVRRKHIENGTHTGLETCLKNILNFLFFVVALYTRLPFFLLWLFAELCGAHFVVAFHCYCCRCLVLVFISYLLCRHLWNFNLHFCCCFALSLCRSLTRTRQLNGRETERERARKRKQLTQILLSHAREADVSGRARRVRVSGLLCIPSLHLIRSRSQGCPLCICFSIVPLSLCFYFVWFSDIPLTIHRHPLCILYLSDICTLHLFLFLWRRCGLYCCLILVRNTCIANFILLHCGQ